VPDNVAPAVIEGAVVKDGQLAGELPPASWNVIRLARPS